MSKATSPTRRERVEKGIYSRQTADGHPAFEVGYRDAQGVQRWRRVKKGGIIAARAALAAAHAKRDRGERVDADPRLRFNDAADQWWDQRATRLRPQTQAAYKACLTHLRARFGRSRMSDISPADVAAFIADQQAAGLKGWTVKGQLTVLSAVFKFATRHLGLVGGSPITSLDRVERPSLEDQRPKRILTPDELGRLISAVDERYRLLFELAAETGGRLSETLGLQWAEVSLDGATVTFTEQLARGGQRRVPLKTKRSRRCIEITPVLARKLREAKLAAPRSGDHDFVFVTRTGSAHDQRNIGGRVLARAVRKAGLESVVRDGEVVLPAPTFHNLRHSHGSALVAGGWDIEEVSARLGHASVATTVAIYINEYNSAARSDDRRDRLAAMYGSEPQSAGEVRQITPGTGA